MKIKLISLDLESSGLDSSKHRPLAIGAVDIENGADYYVGLEWDELTVSTQAMRVNRMDLTAVNRTVGWHNRDLTRTLPAREAIAEFGEWLFGQRKCGDDVELRALGKNPMSFDLPMLRPTWDEFWKHPNILGFPFSHRGADLNSAFALIACAKDLDIGDVRADITDRAWLDFKQSTDRIDGHTCGELFSELEERGGAEHHALGDAWWNVFAWRRCLSAIRGEE